MGILQILRQTLLQVLSILLFSIWFCGSAQGQLTQLYSSYFGGSSTDDILGSSVNTQGTTFYLGTTNSTDLGTTASALQRYHQGGSDAFVSAVDVDGNLLWATYLGSADEEGDAWAIAATPDDRFLYVAFSSTASSLPLVAPTSEQPSNAGNKDVVVVKLRKNGTLMWATFLGGTSDDVPIRMNITKAGGLILSGQTSSSDFPTASAIQNSKNGVSDGFVAKFDESGILEMSTYLGGGGDEMVFEACETSNCGIVLVGHTETPFLNSPKRPYSGAGDLFVVKLSPTYTYEYGTYLGGSSAELGTEWPGIRTDFSDQAYIVGLTNSTDYPTASAIQSNKAGGIDGVITALTTEGDIAWSTFYGGSADDQLTSIEIKNGLLYIGGTTNSTNIPHITSSSAFQQNNGGSGDGLFTTLRANGTVAYSTYYGGNGDDEVSDITFREGFLSFAGHSAGSNFAILNATQSTNAGGMDGQLVLFSAAQLSASLSNNEDATDCSTDDGEITIQLSAAELGTPPYDVSIDDGRTWESSRTNLTANASNQLTLTDVPWGTYIVKVRDALGSQSRAGTVQIKGCVLLMCMQNGNNRLQLPEVVGATNYQWTTTVGSIQSGQGTRTILINTTSMNTGDIGEVCVQAEGPGCDGPAVCVDIQKLCAREYCDNGEDDDNDGLVDCEDQDCPSGNAISTITQN